MSLLYALTGSFDRAGGNVLFAGPPAAPMAGQDLPSARQIAPPLGVAERSLGSARWGWVGTPICMGPSWREEEGREPRSLEEIVTLGN
jgi:hypothetical protein